MAGMLDINEMLSQSMEAVEAAPDFVTPDNGVYNLEVTKIATKHRKAKDATKALAEGKAVEWYDIVMTYAVLDTVQLESSANSLPVRPGSLLQENFQFTDKGLPYFKARVEAIAIAMGAEEGTSNSMSIKDVIDSFPGVAKFQVALKKNTRTHEGKSYEETRFGTIVAIS